MSKTIQTFPLLKYALIGDAVASGGTGLLMVAGAGFLSGMLGLPVLLLSYAGAFLLPYAAVVAFVGTREPIRPRAVWPIIILNILWVADSFALLISQTPSPTLPGVVFVIFQATVVLAFAIAQIIGLRQLKGGTKIMPA